MVGSLYLLGFIIIIFIFFAILIARSSHNSTIYKDIDINEWDCSECGFHIQAGNKCIYCNSNKL